MSKNNINDPESPQFWFTLLQSLSDSDPKDGLNPEINNPIMVMSTSMSIDTPPEGADKMNTPTADGDKKCKRDEEKSNDNNTEEDAKEVTKILGKRPRCNESRNMAEKRRRTEIRNKIHKLKQMIPSCTKKDISSTLDCIIEHIQKMKLYVESQSVGPMMPLGMRMDFPATWFPFIPPNLIMPFNGFTTTQGETSRYDQQFVPITTDQEFNNQPQSSK